jgi:hypothetical protein
MPGHGSQPAPSPRPYTPPGYLFHDHEYFAAISAG